MSIKDILLLPFLIVLVAFLFLVGILIGTLSLSLGLEKCVWCGKRVFFFNLKLDDDLNVWHRTCWKMYWRE